MGQLNDVLGQALGVLPREIGDATDGRTTDRAAHPVMVVDAARAQMPGSGLTPGSRAGHKVSAIHGLSPNAFQMRY